MCGASLGFAVREEVRVDEVVDDRLVRRIEGLELDAHADAAIAPRHATFGVESRLAPGMRNRTGIFEPASSGLVVRMARPP